MYSGSKPFALLGIHQNALTSSRPKGRLYSRRDYGLFPDIDFTGLGAGNLREEEQLSLNKRKTAYVIPSSHHQPAQVTWSRS